MKILLKKHRGDTIFEFAAVLPLFLIMFGGIGIFGWLYWADSISSVAAARSIRESTLNRDNGTNISPGAGTSKFTSSVNFLGGNRTGGEIGGASISIDEGRRMVVLRVNGSTTISFGPLQSDFGFNAGGASRMEKFFPGPPINGWE